MCYVPLKVWPPEAFEEGLELMVSVAKAFENTYCLRCKVVLAEILTRSHHGEGKTAQAKWDKATEKTHSRVKDMMAKP
ncbi:hypothetical protein CONPUDRAFT_156972 [Coniophora puteana RWD-64-598 SS2]|uniref:Cell morphogenesis protein N-terminal domain-containing protein n=1 Tax=Coniophora puteana (strain RWD-64-598) TaxID=741705 RepID=A0A5M3MFH9_CONPW|nr:uncharacterized protein CONPUDRAFT_156972 [Coniophora puteana RWD-64-598 SS2]EIW77787.1 hypothetical protein CONPUDRAFT_156972 [Coniophora puteana RWD-64-598 SS2]